MNTSNRAIFIITVALAGIILTTSCSKESEMNEGKNGEKRTASVKTNASPSTGKDSLTAVRNGQYVDLNWQIDATGRNIKQITVMRSATGVNQQKKVATLEPNATSHKDCLPDANAYWYWIGLVTADGKMQKIGPARVDMDINGSANYTKIGDGYEINITRTDDFATLKWDFPDDDYKEIRIFRYPRPVAELLRGQWNPKGKGKGNTKGVFVTVTMEKKSQFTDALPDANSDYWYWFRITLKSGTVIDRGPIKAGYDSQ